MTFSQEEEMYRTSFDLPAFLWEHLEDEAAKKEIPKVVLLREIIQGSMIDVKTLPKRIVDFRLGEEYINKLDDIAKTARHPHKGNRSQVLEAILRKRYAISDLRM